MIDVFYNIELSIQLQFSELDVITVIILIEVVLSAENKFFLLKIKHTHIFTLSLTRSKSQSTN